MPCSIPPAWFRVEGTKPFSLASTKNDKQNVRFEIKSLSSLFSPFFHNTLSPVSPVPAVQSLALFQAKSLIQKHLPSQPFEAQVSRVGVVGVTSGSITGHDLRREQLDENNKPMIDWRDNLWTMTAQTTRCVQVVEWRLSTINFTLN
jgi:hypothetical protein